MTSRDRAGLPNTAADGRDKTIYDWQYYWFWFTLLEFGGINYQTCQEQQVIIVSLTFSRAANLESGRNACLNCGTALCPLSQLMYHSCLA